MELTQKELEIWLAGIPVLGPVKTMRLLERFQDEAGVYQSNECELMQVEGITEKEVRVVIASKNRDRIKKEAKLLQEKGIRLVTYKEAEYPEKLHHIDKKPYALYVRGALPEEGKVSVAIVGARNCTTYGKEVARWFGREFSKAGIQVISGMAYGVDGEAHRGAIQGSTKTYAVLGSGIDVCYPRENIELYTHLTQQGGVISEYGMGVPGQAFQFPMRNRIISGLSDAVLVVEARGKSGSLITVDLALEQGKEIFAVPGRIGDPLSEGCLNLIKQGAVPVTSPQDIFHNFHLGQIAERLVKEQRRNTMTVEERKIYQSLTLTPIHIEEISQKTKITLAELYGILLSMELKGSIVQTMRNYFIRSI